MSTLAFQPDAERYYSEGYWRDGDLWGEFARNASATPAKTAVHVDGQRISYDELRRAAIALSARLARNEASSTVGVSGRSGAVRCTSSMTISPASPCDQRLCASERLTVSPCAETSTRG